MSRTTPVKLVCQRCGDGFDCFDYRPTRPQKYCSRSCGQPNRKSLVSVACSVCGNLFDRKRYHVAMSGDRGQFCSFGCYGQWQKVNMTGPNNPTYSADSVRRDAWNWKNQRKLSLERDNYKCAQCGSTHRLHVHHLGDANDHVPDNLQTLCASCHRKAHPLQHGIDGKFLSNR